MVNKKAIELSISFLVVLIISIVIFGFGIRFMYSLFSSANDIRDITMEDLDKKIGDVICEGSDRVCIGIDRKKIPKGGFDVFGVKIINILDAQDFDITILPSPSVGYTKDKRPIQLTASFKGLVINPSSRKIYIDKNDERSIGVGVQVPKNAPSGTYIVDIAIKTQVITQAGTPDWQLYLPVQKLYVDVP